ncbi:hypothetical protein ABZW18_21425 [Streptomyces sp. NPDC004647]|uniref:hypothetical protein n=1 Tax=Streptomyces sp. NPDC004647 TaxID=3154671 RepID=UPI0033A5B2C1
MEAVATSVIAVLGTLLGSGVTHVFQRRTAQRIEQFTRDERLRQERLDAFSSYAGALLNYRRSLIDRWCNECDPEVDSWEDGSVLRARSYELHSQAQEALFRVQMLTDDRELVEKAELALKRVTRVADATDRTDLRARRDDTRSLIRDFVTAAKGHVG